MPCSHLVVFLVDFWDFDRVGTGKNLLHLFAAEDVDCDNVHLGVAVLARFGSGYLIRIK